MFACTAPFPEYSSSAGSRRLFTISWYLWRASSASKIWPSTGSSSTQRVKEDTDAPAGSGNI